MLMAYVPGVDGKASVLKHDKATNVYGRKVTVTNVDIASDMVTYKEDGTGYTRTSPRVNYLSYVNKVDESNALRPWWNRYQEDMNHG